MSQQSAAGADSRMHKIQQAVKWTVYALLIINFVYYILEDWNRAVHTLHAASTFLDWTSEFATSIDESAWFLLLFMFELETYVIDEDGWTGWVAHTVRGVRVFCYVLIGHTIYAFIVVVINLQPTVAVENVPELCDMVNADVSYVYNLEYTEVNEQTCAGLSDENQFYLLGEDPIVSDMAGLELERVLAWVDLVEAVTWLLILLTIETVVRLQDREVTQGALLTTANWASRLMYLTLIGLGIYWASLSHWLYLWDELVWIGGFAVIEMNISEWHGELIDKQEPTQKKEQ